MVEGLRHSIRTYNSEYAINQGKLDVLIWLHQMGRHFYDECYNAARNGNLETLIWLDASGYIIDHDVYKYAAYKGHLNIMKFAKEIGYDWSTDTNICYYMAIYGNLEVLIFLREAGCHLGSKTLEYASCHDHLEILIWAYIIGYKLGIGTCIQAASRGHLKNSDLAQDNWLRMELVCLF